MNAHHSTKKGVMEALSNLIENNLSGEALDKVLKFLEKLLNANTTNNIKDFVSEALSNISENNLSDEAVDKILKLSYMLSQDTPNNGNFLPGIPPTEYTKKFVSDALSKLANISADKVLKLLSNLLQGNPADKMKDFVAKTLYTIISNNKVSVKDLPLKLKLLHKILDDTHDKATKEFAASTLAYLAKQNINISDSEKAIFDIIKKFIGSWDTDILKAYISLIINDFRRLDEEEVKELMNQLDFNGYGIIGNDAGEIKIHELLDYTWITGSDEEQRFVTFLEYKMRSEILVIYAKVLLAQKKEFSETFMKAILKYMQLYTTLDGNLYTELCKYLYQKNLLDQKMMFSNTFMKAILKYMQLYTESDTGLYQKLDSESDTGLDTVLSEYLNMDYEKKSQVSSKIYRYSPDTREQLMDFYHSTKQTNEPQDTPVENTDETQNKEVEIIYTTPNMLAEKLFHTMFSKQRQEPEQDIKISYSIGKNKYSIILKKNDKGEYEVSEKAPSTIEDAVKEANKALNEEKLNFIQLQKFEQAYNPKECEVYYDCNSEECEDEEYYDCNTEEANTKKEQCSNTNIDLKEIEDSLKQFDIMHYLYNREDLKEILLNGIQELMSKMKVSKPYFNMEQEKVYAGIAVSTREEEVEIFMEASKGITCDLQNTTRSEEINHCNEELAHQDGHYIL
ncbi:MAG: hypothetical protein ACI8ZF_000564 [Candidatus Midichloriaceae bacterium]